MSTTPPLAPSPSGASITSTAEIIDAALNVWSLVGGYVYVNGKPAAYSANVVDLIYYQGVIYQTNAAGGWWKWVVSAWVQVPGDPRAVVVPPPPPPPPPPGLVASTALPAFNTTTLPAPANLFSIKRQGRYFVDQNGNNILLNGVCCSGLEIMPPYNPANYWAVNGLPVIGSGIGAGTSMPPFSQIKSLGFNCVRIPINTSALLGLNCVDGEGLKVIAMDPAGLYLSYVDNTVMAATAAGLYVDIDIHWSGPKLPLPNYPQGAYLAPEGQGPFACADTDIEAMKILGTRYQNFPNVSLEPFNEPFLDSDGVAWPAAWPLMLNGGTAPQFTNNADGGADFTLTLPWTVAGFNQLIAAARSAGFKGPIHIGSPAYAKDLSSFPLGGTIVDPLNNFGAVWHAYPAYDAAFGTPAYTVPNFATGGSETNVPGNIYTWIEAILAAGIPVTVTEYGGQNSPGTVGEPFTTPLIAWMDAQGLGRFAWCWDAWGNANDVLLSSPQGAPSPGFGQVVFARAAQAQSAPAPPPPPVVTPPVVTPPVVTPPIVTGKPNIYMGSINWVGENPTTAETALFPMKGVLGFQINIPWYQIETSQGVYDFSKIDAIYTALQKAQAGAFLVPLIGGNRDLGGTQVVQSGAAGNQVNVASYDGSGFIPDYILKCGGALKSTDGTITDSAIPVAPNGTQWGFWLSQYEAADPGYYKLFLGGHCFNACINQCLINCWQAFAKHVNPSGKTYGADPLIRFPGLQDEFSYAVGGAGFAGSPTSRPTTTLMRNCMKNLLAAIKAAFPLMTAAANYSYGVTGVDGMQSYATLLADLQWMQANGIAMGDSDIYGNAAKASTCAQLFIGNSYANMNAQAGGGSTLVSGGGTSFVGTMRRLGQCQSDDYDRNSKAGTSIDTAQQVSDIIASAAASGVTDLVLCSCCGSGPMAYKLTWWTSTVYPAIQAYLG